MKPAALYFCVEAKILIDFHICISVPLSSAYKASVFLEINPVPPIFFFTENPSYGKALWQSKLEKRIIDQILGCISFCFEIRAYLGHLFAWTPQIIKFNRWSCSKNEPNTKLNHIFIVLISFYARNAWKNETKNANKNSLFCSIFVIYLIFWPLELRKQHGDPLYLDPIFTYVPLMNKPVKFEEIPWTSLYCILPP